MVGSSVVNQIAVGCVPAVCTPNHHKSSGLVIGLHPNSPLLGASARSLIGVSRVTLTSGLSWSSLLPKTSPISWKAFLSPEAKTQLAHRVVHLSGNRFRKRLAQNGGPWPSLALAAESLVQTAGDLTTSSEIEQAESSRKNTEEDDRIQRLRTWLLQLGWDDCGLAVVGQGQGGVGTYAAVAKEGGVREGDVVVEVPEAALMTEETAARCALLGPLISAHSLNPWQALSAHLLCERARADSFWAPYIDVLPSEADMRWAHPLLWATEERREWLEGSPTLEVLETRLAQCRSDFEALQQAGVGAAFADEFGRKVLTEESVRWAAATLLSRAFSLDLDLDRDEPMLALVPWADLLNHSSAATGISCLVFDHETRVAILGAHTNYQPGQEVYDSYGPGLSPGQLFLDYGFVDWEHVANTVDLPASVLGRGGGKGTRALLRAVGLPAESTVFSMSPAGLDDTLLAWTRVAVATPDELASAGWTSERAGFESAGRAMAKFVEPVSRRNELQALLLLIRACDEQLRRYPLRAIDSQDSSTEGFIDGPKRSSFSETSIDGLQNIHRGETSINGPQGSKSSEGSIDGPQSGGRGEGSIDGSEWSSRLIARKTADRLISSEHKAVSGARKWLLKELQKARSAPEG